MIQDQVVILPQNLLLLLLVFLERDSQYLARQLLQKIELIYQEVEEQLQLSPRIRG